MPRFPRRLQQRLLRGEAANLTAGDGVVVDVTSSGVHERRQPLDRDDLRAVDLAQETQDLRVRVMPSVGDSASTVIALVNPLLAVIPFVETGPGEDTDCGQLMQRVKSEGVKAPAKPAARSTAKVSAKVKTKAKAKRAMRDMADELLKLYAERKLVGGYSFAADTPWQQEFEDGFPFVLTPDQETAIEDVKKDMEEPVPMDRLLCGVVGYG